MNLNEYIQLIVEEKAREIVNAHEKALDKAFSEVDALEAPSAEPLKMLPQSFPQEWPAYNAAQTEEKLLFLDLLAELCSTIEDKRKPSAKGGRPTLDLDEMAFCCTNKVYEGLSSRRATSDLELAKRRGYLSQTPHFNSVLNYFNNEELTPILAKLIELSALPLKGFETTFAADASGLSSAFYSRWLDYRFNEDRRFHDWLKIHLMIGTKTQIVTAIAVTDGHASDSPMFPALLKKTAENFDVQTVCADKGYSSRENIQLAWDAGAIPFIPFKEGTTGKSRGSGAWRKMWLLFQLYKERFYKHYHQRSLVKASFSALKRKFQGKLMLKSEVGKVNEALAKVLCYNICVLIHEMKKNGIEVKISEHAQKPAELHNNPLQAT